MISNRGDFELLLDGIYENILQLHYVDPLMQKTVQCLDNLGVSDVTHQYIMRTQKMSLLVYQPPIAIFIHGLIAQLERKDIEWPKSLQRHRTVLAERMDMFHTWRGRISPYISRHLSTKSFVEDSISSLLHILSPPTLRPATLHLISDKEKSDMGQLVHTMVSYAITYKNIKSDRSDTWRHEDASEATTTALDPPLGDFIHYKDYNSCHTDLALVVKQLLVNEAIEQGEERELNLLKMAEGLSKIILYAINEHLKQLEDIEFCNCISQRINKAPTAATNVFDDMESKMWEENYKIQLANIKPTPPTPTASQIKFADDLQKLLDKEPTELLTKLLAMAAEKKKEECKGVDEGEIAK